MKIYIVLAEKIIGLGFRETEVVGGWESKTMAALEIEKLNREEPDLDYYIVDSVLEFNQN